MFKKAKILIFMSLVLIVAGACDKTSPTANTPTFELVNRASQQIWVKIGFNYVSGELKGTQGGTKPVALEANIGKFAHQIPMDINLVRLEIYEKEPGFLTTPDRTYLIDNTATRYLAWDPTKNADPTKQLSPQTGKWFGWSATSDSGYSLKNNVKVENIKYLAAN